ncbi:MAG TPA: sigma-70 family RNA polymerase sigma factor [Acidimicrobiales bacterium]
MDGHAEVTAVWRRESGRLVGALARLTRDVDLAEDLGQDALVEALEQWPRRGIPDNPAAWLMTTARRRAIDRFRRAATLDRRTRELARRLEQDERERQQLGRPGAPGPLGRRGAVTDVADHLDHIEDDVLRLLFLTCHPALTPASRVALTLRLVGGLTTAEIARAFLVGEATMAQRISRAKTTLRAARPAFELPVGDERRARLADVMAVVYLVFNEGYAATAGDRWTRPDLCREGVRLARLLAGLVPDEPEVHGLRALVELQAARTPARTTPTGAPVLLDDQDRSLWDHALVDQGLAALHRAARSGRPIGAYTLQASIAACHAQAATPAATDWPLVAALYDRLAAVAPGPVVEVNRAVAHGRAFGPDTGLAVLDGVELPGSSLLPAVRGDLLAAAGRHREAAAAFVTAAGLTANRAEQELLRRRAAEQRAATGDRER